MVFFLGDPSRGKYLGGFEILLAPPEQNPPRPLCVPAHQGHENKNSVKGLCCVVHTFKILLRQRGRTRIFRRTLLPRVLIGVKAAGYAQKLSSFLLFAVSLIMIILCDLIAGGILLPSVL